MRCTGLCRVLLRWRNQRCADVDVTGGGFGIHETVFRPTSRWLGADPDSSKKRRQTGNLKMQCLHVNISDRYTCATNGSYSVLFVLGHVSNRDTKIFISSCNIPHFTMCRTQAKKPHINCRKGLTFGRETQTNAPWRVPR